MPRKGVNLAEQYKGISRDLSGCLRLSKVASLINLWKYYGENRDPFVRVESIDLVRAASTRHEG